MTVFERPHKNKQLSKRILLLSVCRSLLGVQLGCVAHSPRFNQYDKLNICRQPQGRPALTQR